MKGTKGAKGSENSSSFIFLFLTHLMDNLYTVQLAEPEFTGNDFTVKGLNQKSRAPFFEL